MFVRDGVNQQVRLAKMCEMERDLSVSSDESEAPVEANMWRCWVVRCWNVGGDICGPTVCDMFAVMMTPIHRVSVVKFTFVETRVMSRECRFLQR